MWRQATSSRAWSPAQLYLPSASFVGHAPRLQPLSHSGRVRRIAGAYPSSGQPLAAPLLYSRPARPFCLTDDKLTLCSSCRSLPFWSIEHTEDAFSGDCAPSRHGRHDPPHARSSRCHPYGVMRDLRAPRVPFAGPFLPQSRGRQVGSMHPVPFMSSTAPVHTLIATTWRCHASTASSGWVARGNYCGPLSSSSCSPSAQHERYSRRHMGWSQGSSRHL